MLWKIEESENSYDSMIFLGFAVLLAVLGDPGADFSNVWGGVDALA